MNEPHTTTNRWRGLVTLVRTVVDQGSRAIERVQTEEVARAVAVVGRVPQLRTAAKAVGAVHDLVVATTHARIRQVAEVVEAIVVAGIDARAHAPESGQDPTAAQRNR